MKKNRLLIAETFYSIQGEGKTAGCPAVFLRLGACNLNCDGFSYRNEDTGEHLGCDTKAVWRIADKHSFENIVSQWSEKNWLHPLKTGAHLVITGGEPLLQQTALLAFLEYLDLTLAHRCFVEIETNATIAIQPVLLARLDSINASPKLSNSGEAFEKVYTLPVLRALAATPKAFFKFVVSDPRNVDEILTHFVMPLELSRERVYLMAEGGTNKALDEKEQWLVECCKNHGFQFSPRLHIRIWGEVTGV